MCFTWLGMASGISFLEAPLKFRAPGVPLRLGLGIGRVVFRALHRVELALLVVALAAAALGPGPVGRLTALAPAALILAGEASSVSQALARVPAPRPDVVVLGGWSRRSAR